MLPRKFGNSKCQISIVGVNSIMSVKDITSKHSISNSIVNVLGDNYPSTMIM